MPPAPRAIAAVALLGMSALATACGEQKVVSQTGLLSGLPGAQTGIPDRRKRTQAQVLSLPATGLREVHDDGSVTIHSKNVRHLMSHIVYAIQHDEQDVFVQQILCRQTLEEFNIRHVDPALGFQEVVRRQRDVFKLFNLMPFGEGTPGMFLEPTGTNEFRLALPKSSYGDLKWVGIDTVFEDGNFKLRWFVNR